MGAQRGPEENIMNTEKTTEKTPQVSPITAEMAMTNNWADLKGKIKTRFGKLTDENIESVKGNLELLTGKLQPWSAKVAGTR